MLGLTLTNPYGPKLLGKAAEKRGYGTDIAFPPNRDMHEGRFHHTYKLLADVHGIVKGLEPFKATQS